METILGILSSPSEVFRALKEKPKILFGLILFLSAWSHFFLALLLFFNVSFSLTGFIFLLSAFCFVSLASLLLKAMWIHFVSELLGGEGKISSLFTLLCLGTLPLHLAVPLTQAGQLLSPIFTILGWILLFSWSSKLHFKAVQENYQISRAKTMIVLFSPTLLFFILLVGIGIFLFAALAGFFASFGSAIKSLPT